MMQVTIYADTPEETLAHVVEWLQRQGAFADISTVGKPAKDRLRQQSIADAYHEAARFLSAVIIKPKGK